MIKVVDRSFLTTYDYQNSKRQSKFEPLLNEELVNDNITLLASDKSQKFLALCNSESDLKVYRLDNIKEGKLSERHLHFKVEIKGIKDRMKKKLTDALNTSKHQN